MNIHKKRKIIELVGAFSLVNLIEKKKDITEKITNAKSTIIERKMVKVLIK